MTQSCTILTPRLHKGDRKGITTDSSASSTKFKNSRFVGNCKDPRTSTGSAGLAYSINTWITKLAMGLTGFILAQFLSQGHYVEGGVTQPPGLSFWIMAGFVWLPLGAVCMQALCLLAWRDRERVQNDA